VKALFFFFSIAVSLSAQDHPQFVWQGQVDGTVILHLAAKHLAVQIQDGAPVERQKFHFSDALPQSQENVRVQVLEGRGYVHIVDQPNIENHYTLTLAIEDRQPGSSFYSIALNWNTSSNIFEGAQQKTDQVTWTGRVDEAAIVSCHARKCVSSSEPGAPASAPVSNESFQFSRPLPEREVDVRLEYPEGRGEIRLIEQPRHQNNYTARVSIHDPLAGAGEYSFTLVWNRLTSKELKEESKESAAISEPAERGLVWSGTLNGRVRVTLQGGASFSEVLEGARIQHEHAEILRRLPARADLMPAIQKLHGRGRVSIVEAPSEKNNYRLIFEIDDPGPGADDYEVELDW
jgi:hypothetical protein